MSQRFYVTEPHLALPLKIEDNGAASKEPYTIPALFKKAAEKYAGKDAIAVKRAKNVD
jgi:hypothetical protein